MASSVYKKVGIASLIMTASIFASRLIGVFREMAIAYTGGASGSVDAYQVAFIIPEILNHVVASGFLSVTFIPIFSHYLAAGEEDRGWELFSVIMTVFGGILVLLTALAFVLTPHLVRLLAPGLTDPGRFHSAVRMTRIIMPAQIFFFAGGLFMAVQFAKERFAVPALAPLIYNLGIIAGGLLGGRWLGMEGFAWGVLAGAFIGNCALQYVGARRIGMRFRFLLRWRHPDLKRYILLTIPLMLGLTMTFVTEIFLKYFGSHLPPGSIAALNYALRIMYIVVALFGQAVGVASYPFLTRLAAEGKVGELNRLLNSTLRYLALVIPLSALFMALRHETVLVLFQRGRFDAAATAITSRLLIFLMLGAFAFAVQTVVVRGFYATQNTLLPALFSTAAAVISLPIYVYGLRYFGADGVALAVSLSAILQVVMLFNLWNRRSGNAGSRSVYLFYLRVIGLSIPLGLLLERLKIFLHTVIDTTTLTGCLVTGTITLAVFLSLLIAAAYALRLEEVIRLGKKLAARLGSGKTHGP
ncbi:MAG: murein biosynthesis integral membrane protein MurJ [Thermodesulfobacteriota bacterium]